MADAVIDMVTNVLPFGLKQAQLRGRAREARMSRDRAREAVYRRRLCESRFAQPRDWVQYGHALKELGFFTEAEKAYRTAQRLSPEDPEVALQLGHLFKVSDRFEAADACFHEALDLGYGDRAEPLREIDQLRRATSVGIFPERTSGIQPQGIHYYLSSPSRVFSEGSRSSLIAGLADGNHSYAFAMRGFIEALEALGMPYSIIQNPEFVVDIRARSDAAINVHLAFYPPEQIRLLKGAWNIACFAWEFERLRSKAESMSYHAFADQGTMLEIMDEIWVPSSEAAGVVGRAAKRPVRHVPAPVLSNHRLRPRPAEISWLDLDHQARILDAIEWQPLAIVPRIQGTMNEMARDRQSRLQSIVRSLGTDAAPRIFLTVLNVRDFRKQLRPLIEGFVNFSLEHPEALLLIKMTTSGRGDSSANDIILMNQLLSADYLALSLVSDRIWITDDLLTRQEMNALYDLAEFYICTPFTERQNLPLIEAMARGCIPVTPDHSAMRDYISSDNAVVIPSTLEFAEPRITLLQGMWGIRANVISADSAADAMIAAVTMVAQDKADRSCAATAAVQAVFGLEAFESQLAGLEDRLKATTG